MNKVILIGRIANDIKLNYTQSGTPYIRATIAVNRRQTSRENQQTDFISLVAWRNTASFMSQYVNKGSLVSIEGQLTVSQFSSKENGQINRSTDVTVENISLLEPRSVIEKRQGSVQNINPQTNNFSNNVKFNQDMSYDENNFQFEHENEISKHDLGFDFDND